MQQCALAPLIGKLQSPIQEIQGRSISNIYTKLSNTLVPYQNLLKYPEMPGLLMTWINEGNNRRKSQLLFKVIWILGVFAQLEEGRILLRKYQCLEFCEQFRQYLIQNERGIDAYLQQLDHIIRNLMPLGRSQEEINNNNSNTVGQDPKDNLMVQQKKQERKQTKKQIKVELKFRPQLNPLDESDQKAIFQLLMKVKYANKDTIYITLVQMRQWVSHFMTSSFRCKGDLIAYMYELSMANVFPQLCMEIIAILVKGLTISEKASTCAHSNQLVSLTYAKTYAIKTIQVQIQLPLKIFDLIGSFILVHEIINAYKQLKQAIPSRYLLSIRYAHSAELYIKILQCLSEGQLLKNQDLVVQALQQYGIKYPQSCKQFLSRIPSALIPKIPVLTSYESTTQLQQSFSKIEPYLHSRQFQVTKNLHIMREIIDNLKQGFRGVQQQPRHGVKLYIDVLVVLAISVSKQDHVMAYYTQIQALVIGIAQKASNKVAAILYQELLNGLKNNKPVVNYPGLVVPRHEVLQIVFTSPEFTKKIVQFALENQQMLLIMLSIVNFFIEKDKFKIFTPFVAVLFALCSHPSETVSMMANTVISKMPKNFAVACIACKLFSTNAENRKKLLSDLSNSKIQVQPDIIQKIASGHFVNKKKELKLSAETIQNYLNIIFNPGLEISIRQTAIGQFIDCFERAEGTQNYQFNEAQILLVEQIRKLNKKDRLEAFQQKIIVLHLLLCQKIDGMCESFTIEFMIGMLCKIVSQQCKAYILTAIYLRIFRSPFSSQKCVKSWVMMYYPHAQMVKMAIQSPIRQQQQKTGETVNKQVSIHSNKNFNRIQQIYYGFVQSICKRLPLQKEIEEILQEQIVSAVTTLDIAKISKLSFFCHSIMSHCSNGGPNPVGLDKSTIKILLQHIRTNQMALDLADDLIRMLRCTQSNSIAEVLGNLGNLAFTLASYGSNPNNFGLAGGSRHILNQQVDKIFRYLDDNLSRAKIYKFLIRQTMIKYSHLSQYNNLRLIQSIIATVRSSTSNQNFRILALSTLQKLIGSQFKMEDHSATIMALLRSFLTENKLTTLQFALALDCYSSLIKNQHLDHQTAQVIANAGDKITINIIQQICTLIVHSTNPQNNTKLSSIMLSCCFSFINNMIKPLIVEGEQGQPDYCSPYIRTIQNHPNNLLILTTTLLPKKLPDFTQRPQENQETVLLLTQIYTFFYFCTCYNEDAIFTLLNSTDLLASSLSYIVPLSVQSNSNQTKGLDNRIQLIQSIARLLHSLAKKADQFIFKLNKVVKIQGGNTEFKIHYTLMSPIPLLKKHYQNKQKRNCQFSYFKMICWILHIWKQQSGILQEEQFMEPLVSSIMQIKDIKIISPLLMKSAVAQKMALNSSLITQKLKFWLKQVQELLYQKTKTSKKILAHSKLSTISNPNINIHDHQSAVEQGLVVLTTLFHPIQASTNLQENSPIFRQNLSNAVKFVDSVYCYLDTEPNESFMDKVSLLLSNLCRNQMCSKQISAIITESNLQTLTRLIARIQKSSQNMMQVSTQLSLLSMMSYNESVRSAIAKNKLVQFVVNALIAMDENKVAKVNYGIAYCAVCFLVFMSLWKEVNAKIMNDKKLIDILVRILALQQSSIVQQKILQLIVNLSAFKHSKAQLMACKQIHKICLGLLSDPQYQNKQRVLQIIYNILYKNAAGIKLYKKKQVYELMNGLKEVKNLQQVCGQILEILNASQ